MALRLSCQSHQAFRHVAHATDLGVRPAWRRSAGARGGTVRRQGFDIAGRKDSVFHQVQQNADVVLIDVPKR
jgi:hypothetical protein